MKRNISSLPTEAQIAKWSKKSIEKWYPDRDTFTTLVSVPLPEKYVSPLSVWLNIQHTGKRILGVDAVIPEKLKDAHHRLRCGRMVELKWMITMEGDWMLIGAKEV